LEKGKQMFSDNIGFNPFDKDNNVHANGYAQNRQRFLPFWLYKSDKCRKFAQEVNYFLSL
jgi:hypothetical protein